MAFAMIAVREVKYGGVLHAPGDKFEVAAERDAKILALIGKAEFGSAGDLSSVFSEQEIAKRGLKAEVKAPSPSKPKVADPEPPAQFKPKARSKAKPKAEPKAEPPKETVAKEESAEK